MGHKVVNKNIIVERRPDIVAIYPGDMTSGSRDGKIILEQRCRESVLSTLALERELIRLERTSPDVSPNDLVNGYDGAASRRGIRSDAPFGPSAEVVLIDITPRGSVAVVQPCDVVAIVGDGTFGIAPSRRSGAFSDTEVAQRWAEEQKK